MSNRNSRQRVVLVSVLSVSAVALAAVVVGSALTIPRAEAAISTPNELVSKASPLVPAFGASQSAADKMPTFLQSGPQSFEGVDPQTSRSLGSKDGVFYWVALQSDGQICLISLLPGVGQNASETCQTPAVVAASGIGLQFADATKSINAYLIPSGYAGTSRSYVAVSPQLLVGNGATAGTPLVSRVKVSSVKVPDGMAASLTPSTFAPLSPSGAIK
jgi:hypothetical protein